MRGSNVGYIVFRGSVKSTGYPLHSPVPPSVRHRVPSHCNCSLPYVKEIEYVNLVFDGGVLSKYDLLSYYAL